MKLRIAMLGLNVYHFFFRKWCWRQCFVNLFKLFWKESEVDEERSENNYNPNSDRMNQKQIRHTADILILGYMIGVATMPGGNYQF